ncbi:MAG: helix-turn-helix domain-containing protein [Nanoarchaeota archaeon]|nr:helix-turn-helix domain-containing protein [Nanoarchaeota archaeon]
MVCELTSEVNLRTKHSGVNMQTPQEIEVKYVLPVLRRELAKQMIKLGLSQKDAAKKLGISGAAVSQYLKKKRGTEGMKMPMAEITKSAKAIMKGEKTEAIEEINRLCRVIRKTRVLCCVHKKYGKPLKGCAICLK